MLKYHSLLTILVFTFCLLCFLAESSSDTTNSNTTCQDELNYIRAEFSIDVCLINQVSQYAAMISLRNNNTSDVYELKVSQSYIDQNAQMSLLYEDPQKFFSLLKQEESTITTNSNAQILIQNKFFKVLRLIPRKQILDTIDNITNRLIILQDKQKEMIEQEEKLNQSLSIMMLENNITQILSQMDLLRQEKDAQIALLKAELQLLQRPYYQNWINFAIQKSNNNLKLKYTNQWYWYGFLKSPHIQVGKITRLQVRQTKTTSKTINYGVSTDKTMGQQNPYNNLECKTYHALSGGVYQNSVWRAGGALINDGTVVTIIADLIAWKIIWEADGIKLTEADISTAMRANKLYFIIMMHYQNDEVEILDY